MKNIRYGQVGKLQVGHLKWLQQTNIKLQVSRIVPKCVEICISFKKIRTNGGKHFFHHMIWIIALFTENVYLLVSFLLYIACLLDRHISSLTGGSLKFATLDMKKKIQWKVVDTLCWSRICATPHSFGKDRDIAIYWIHSEDLDHDVQYPKVLYTAKIQYDHLELLKSKLLYLSSETSLDGSQQVKMTVTLGHFDI